MILSTSIDNYITQLRQDEKSKSTLEQYERNIRNFIDCMKENVGENKELTKESVICYKEMLQSQHNYSVSTINGILTAVNGFLKFLGKPQFCVKQLKQQKKIFLEEEKLLTEEEYNRLLDAAEAYGKLQIFLIMETICSTGIRVSELPYITTDAVEYGMANINLKGKNRVIFLSDPIRKNLKAYMKKENITSGAIFTTKNGNIVHRSNIWREMKKLSKLAGVNPKKVFPHNLRHLFARRYHEEKNDIAMLADVLGHSNIDTTRIYLMSTGEDHKKIINRLRLVRLIKKSMIMESGAESHIKKYGEIDIKADVKECVEADFTNHKSHCGRKKKKRKMRKNKSKY